MNKQNNLREIKEERNSWRIFSLVLIGGLFIFVIFLSISIGNNYSLQKENEMLKGQIENYSCRIILTDTVELDILNWNKPIVKVLYYFISEKERSKLFLRYNLKEEDCDVLK